MLLLLYEYINYFKQLVYKVYTDNFLSILNNYRH